MTLATAYRNKIDALWLDFHSGGITNPITVIEQISYLMFARLLDITESREEKRAAFRDPPLFRVPHALGLARAHRLLTLFTTSPMVRSPKYRFRRFFKAGNPSRASLRKSFPRIWCGAWVGSPPPAGFTTKSALRQA
jgi:hypothetical protein